MVFIHHMSKCKLVQRQQISNRLNFTKTKHFNNDLEGLVMLLRNEAYSKQACFLRSAMLLYTLYLETSSICSQNHSLPSLLPSLFPSSCTPSNLIYELESNNNVDHNGHITICFNVGGPSGMGF